MSALSVRTLGDIVSARYNVSWYDLISLRRTARVVRPRQILMWLARHHTPRSLPEIGRRLGGRDHTTVLHSVRRIDEMMADDPAFAAEVEELRTQAQALQLTLEQVAIRFGDDVDVFETAERVLTQPRGEFSLSLQEIVAMALHIHAQPPLIEIEDDEDETPVLVVQASADAQERLARLLAAVRTFIHAGRAVARQRSEEDRFLARERHRAAYLALTETFHSIWSEVSTHEHDH